MKIGIISTPPFGDTETRKAREAFGHSTLFRCAWAYAEKEYDQVFLLSPKYGLIDLDTVVEFYDIDIEKVRAHEFEEWGELVGKQVREKIPAGSELNMLIGDKFRDVIKYIGEGYVINFPLANQGGIGQQIKFYKQALGLADDK